MAYLESLAVQLEASPDYRVLRRLAPRPLTGLSMRDDRPLGMRLGLILDVETEGLDHKQHQIIELAAIQFAFMTDGSFLGVMGEFQGFRDPGRMLSPEITKLTGITDDVVAGQRIDDIRIAGIAAPADLIIAHNASFDRRFVEIFAPLFERKAWACSLSQVDWAGHGFQGSKLGYLLAGFGLFHDGHRALDDCHATLEILSRPLPGTDQTALAELLTAARMPMQRVIADRAPFDAKDALKARGYFGSDGTGGKPKAWCRDIPETDVDAEMAWLASAVYQGANLARLKRITAFDRYSVRADVS